MCNEEYNGWNNRETWSMNLWITNEPYWDESCADMTLENLKAYPNGNRTAILNEIAKDFHEFIEDEFSLENVKDNGLWNLYNVVREIGSLDRVNWHEIAEHYVGIWYVYIE